MNGKGDLNADWTKLHDPHVCSSSHSEKATGSRLHPLDGAGFLSLCTMSWMTPMMWSMSRKQLDFSWFRLSPLDGADTNGEQLQNLWDQEVCTVGLQKASLTRVLLRFQRDRLLLVLCINVLFMLSLFVGSGVLFHEILLHILHQESSVVWVGVTLCLGLVTVELFRVLCLTLSWAINLRTGIRLKAGFCMLGFNKIISLRMHSSVSVEQMVNVLTSDSYKLFGAVLLVPLVLPFPILLIICFLYTCYILDYTALIGFSIFTTFIILQFVFARLINRFQQQAVTITAVRVHTVTELLTCIKLIKMYVWEEAFSSKITGIRNSERKMLEKASLIQNISVSISPLVPIIATMSTLVIHTWLGLPLNTYSAYPVFTIFTCMRFILSLTPTAVNFLAGAAASVVRLKRLLLIKNPKPYVLQKTGNSSEAIIMTNATLSWTKTISSASREDKNGLVLKPRQPEATPTLRNISFHLKKGRLLGVCGRAGSGKTSLICSLLEQMHLQQGSVSVDGSIAYVSQQAWIFYGTVQNNILMGESLDRSRYNRVIISCCLEKDLCMLPQGDQTMLGEQGVNLSEGQKQRISLARAVYSNKDVYLLDDPLSAIDAHMGRQIFEECIKKQLQGKSIMMVTHQLEYMESCDEVLVMKDGTVLETGSHLDLMRAEGHYAELITKHLKEQPLREEEMEMNVELNVGQNEHVCGGIVNPVFQMTEETDAPSPDCKSADQLIDQENNRSSLVTWRTFQQYCLAAGGYCVSFFILLLFILLVINAALSNIWITLWLSNGHGRANVTSSEQGNVSLNPDLPFYQLWFAVIVAVLLILCLIKAFCFIKVSFQASTALHNSLLRKIIESPMSFFNSTPTVHLLSCFSRYQDEVDSLVPHHLNVVLTFWLIAVCVCIIISIVFPIMLLSVFILVTVLSFLLLMFRGNIIQLKKMENLSRSPCISFCTSITQGLSTIQTYNKMHDFTRLFKKLSDSHANHLLLSHYGMQWLCFLADSLCAAMTLPVALLVVFVSNDVSSPPIKALALGNIIQLTSNSQSMIQSLLEVEIKFISVQRLLNYITGCESEVSGQPQVGQVSEDWPQHGTVTFLDYCMKYRKSSPVVLSGLQLHIRAREKLAVLGAAGSGKASLADALFRLVEPAAGSILIDGVDITSIHLSDLRRKLSIIPQDPVLFTGTVRFNLDPCNSHSDEEIWAALEKTCMKDTICSLGEKLQAELKDIGGKLSVGQKQLLCISRALLRDSKILLLDESMASVDEDTDALIQITIREAFKRCTLLTIARRISTVLQADRILVLDQGEVVEFDHPDVVIRRPDSLFSYLLTSHCEVMDSQTH